MKSSKVLTAAAKVPANVFLAVVLVFVMFPVVYTFLASFKSNQELLTAGASIIPKKFVLDNYIQAWKIADFKTYTFNSVYLSFFVVTGSLIITSMAGYAFERGDFKGKNLIFGVFVSTMFIALGSITMYPLLSITKHLHINNSLWGIILIRVFGLNITSTYLIRGYVKSLPKELDEAAHIDGCSFFRTYMHIIFPLLKPILATLCILTFQSSWNDYLLPMVFTLANPKKAPLVVGIMKLRNTGEAASSWNLMLAGASISMIPIIIVYAFANKYFISGITSGAVKG